MDPKLGGANAPKHFLPDFGQFQAFFLYHDDNQHKL